MHDSGLALFFWMTIGFTIMYLLVLSTFTVKPRQPAIITVNEARRKKRNRELAMKQARQPEEVDDDSSAGFAN